MSIATLLHQHHAYCDELFVSAENAGGGRDWIAAQGALSAFVNELEKHFDIEENLLFPAFENATGMSDGPTQVMRMEHSQMRSLLGQMGEAVAAGDTDAFGGAADTLLLLMQQHNMKEENILYPMCDRALVGSDVFARVQERVNTPVGV